MDNYTLMAHEVGHALGLSGVSLPRVLRQSYEMAHATIPDSVMNYDWEVPSWAYLLAIDEPDCSPHPFDIMIIYALYQTVD